MFLPVTGDPHYNSVSLHLPMTGANNSTTFTDVSPSPKTITRNGDTKISTAQSRWGQGSGYFDGTGDYLSITGESLSTNDFTVEAWIYVAIPSSAFIIFDSRNADQSDIGFAFYTNSSGKLVFGRGTTFVATAGSTTVSANTWYHAALTRSSGVVRGFLNGVKEFEVTDTKTFSNPTWRVGQGISLGTFSAGYIQDLRVTNGLARYIADFTVPSSPLPARLPELPVQRAIIQPSFHQIARLGL
jgi:hypothetical protein